MGCKQQYSYALNATSYLLWRWCLVVRADADDADNDVYAIDKALVTVFGFSLIDTVLDSIRAVWSNLCICLACAAQSYCCSKVSNLVSFVRGKQGHKQS